MQKASACHNEAGEIYTVEYKEIKKIPPIQASNSNKNSQITIIYIILKYYLLQNFHTKFVAHSHCMTRSSNIFMIHMQNLFIIHLI